MIVKCSLCGEMNTFHLNKVKSHIICDKCFTIYTRDTICETFEDFIEGHLCDS